MNFAANATFRRAFLALLFGAGMTASWAARSESETAPPPLMSATSQFVELRPLIEAPPLKLERIDGKMVDLGSLRGKVVLLSFWATWCPPCRRELPLLERLQRILGPRDFEAVAISIDRKDAPVVRAFLKDAGVRHLQPFLDPSGRIAVHSAEDGGSPFVLYGMPISYVIDRQGRPTGYITGEVDWASDEGLALLRHYIADGR
jgi:thiol-disulfide isomerase/thioredoxin